MPGSSLAELVGQYPATAEAVSNSLDAAVNTVLPGSDTHGRYADIEEVGLAIVVASSTESQSYSPFDTKALSRLAFRYDNQQLRPDVWQPNDADEDILGGKIPKGMGRFTAYALAKINTLDDSIMTVSHSIVGPNIAPGKVGIAGGRWVPKSLLAVSGLWEVHDHVMAGTFAAEMTRVTAPDPLPKTGDDLAADIERKFAMVKSLHEGARAEDLNRTKVAKLLVKIDGLA